MVATLLIRLCFLVQSTDAWMLLVTAVAQLPLEPYYINDSGYKEKFIKHPTYYLLNKEPNQKMSRFTFIKTLIVSTLLKGNGYAYIERDTKGDAMALYYIQPDYVTITEQKDGIRYNVVGIKGLVEPCNMIHILNFSYNGITGISTLEHAKQTLGLATDSESHRTKDSLKEVLIWLES